MVEEWLKSFEYNQKEDNSPRRISNKIKKKI